MGIPRGHKVGMIWLATMVASLALAQSAGAYVYWTIRGGGSGTTLGRANTNGSSPNSTFITGATGPVGVVVDANYIYWANTFGSHSTIGRAAINGNSATVNQSFITGASSPCGVAVDANYIYWANNGTGTIGRAALDGNPATVNQSFITGATNPCGVAVNGSYVYWANEGSTTIGRAPITGGAGSTFISGLANPVGVAVNNSYIYWGNNTSNTVGRDTIDGNAANVNNSFITGQGGCTDFPAVDSTYIYWANDCDSSIGRDTLDGNAANINENFIATASNPGGVAVDALPTSGGSPPPPSLQPPSGTTITNFKRNKHKHRATVSFTAAGTVTGFQCALVKQKKKKGKKGKHNKKPKLHFTLCSSPKTYKHVKHGKYTFEVRAFNAAGVDPTPAVKKFKL